MQPSGSPQPVGGAQPGGGGQPGGGAQPVLRVRDTFVEYWEPELPLIGAYKSICIAMLSNFVAILIEIY